MWVLLVEVHARRLSVQRYRRVEADLVSREGGRPVQQVLAPQVRVGTRLVHGSVWLEIALDVELILLQHQVDFLFIGGVEDLLEVAADAVLLVVEAVEVGPPDGEDVLGHQLSEHAPNGHKHGYAEGARSLTCRGG